MKDFIKKYWEGALVAQIGLGFLLYKYFTVGVISSVGLSIFVIGNIILLGKLFYKNKLLYTFCGKFVFASFGS